MIFSEVSCKLLEETSNLVATSASTTTGIDLISQQMKDPNVSFMRIDNQFPILEEKLNALDMHLQRFGYNSLLLDEYMVREFTNIKSTLQVVPGLVEQVTTHTLNSKQRQSIMTGNDDSLKNLAHSSGQLSFKRSIRGIAKSCCSCQSQANQKRNYSYWYSSLSNLQSLRSVKYSGSHRPDCPSRFYSEKKDTLELTYSHCNWLFSGILRAR